MVDGRNRRSSRGIPRWQVSARVGAGTGTETVRSRTGGGRDGLRRVGRAGGGEGGAWRGCRRPRLRERRRN